MGKEVYSCHSAELWGHVCAGVQGLQEVFWLQQSSTDTENSWENLQGEAGRLAALQHSLPLQNRYGRLTATFSSSSSAPTHPSSVLRGMQCTSGTSGSAKPVRASPCSHQLPSGCCQHTLQQLRLSATGQFGVRSAKHIATNSAVNKLSRWFSSRETLVMMPECL